MACDGVAVDAQRLGDPSCGQALLMQRDNGVDGGHVELICHVCPPPAGSAGKDNWQIVVSPKWPTLRAPPGGLFWALADREAGFAPRSMQLALSRDNARFFGTLDLDSPVATGVSLAIG